jgi:hypothetical protein
MGSIAGPGSRLARIMLTTTVLWILASAVFVMLILTKAGIHVDPLGKNVQVAAEG